MNVCLRRFTRPLLVSLLATAMAGGAWAEGIADRVTVTDPYVRAVPPVVKTTAAFMQLQSDDDEERFLVSASTPVAGAVELHMHVQDGEVMRMRRIVHIHLPSRQTVSLQPGGLHIMLFDLKQPLSAGDEVPITLTFEDGSSKDIVAVVRPVHGPMKKMMH
jgi:copper(I)-binding protein